MCACLALKKLTKFRTHWGQKNLLSSHKKSPQKTAAMVPKNALIKFQLPLPSVKKNRTRTMGYRTKKIIRPQPWWPVCIQCANEQKQTIDQKNNFNIMVLLSHSRHRLSSINLIFLIPQKTGQWWYTTRPKKSSKKTPQKSLISFHCPARVYHDPPQSVHKKPQRAKKLLTNRAKCACKK